MIPENFKKVEIPKQYVEFFQELGVEVAENEEGFISLFPYGDFKDDRFGSIPVCENGALCVCGCITFEELVAAATSVYHACNQLAWQHHLAGCL